LPTPCAPARPDYPSSSTFTPAPPHEFDFIAFNTTAARHDKAGDRLMVCPLCFNAKQLDKGGLLPNAELARSVQLWEWIGDQGATTFRY
jgi:hypothetical protein